MIRPQRRRNIPRNAARVEPEGRRQVDLQDGLPVLVLHAQRQIVSGQPGIVDQHVRTAVGVGGSDQPLRGLRIGQLGHFHADPLAEPFGKGRKRVAAPAGKHHRGTLRVQLSGDGLANAARGSGDQSAPSRKIEHRHASEAAISPQARR